MSIRSKLARILRRNRKNEPSPGEFLQTDWDWNGEGDDPHQKVCADGSTITFGICGEDGFLRRARPEDFPPGCWPPVGIVKEDV